MKMNSPSETKGFVLSIKDSSLHHKFAAVFLLISIVPLGVLWYFFYDVKDNGTLQVSQETFEFILWLVALGVGTGFVVLYSIVTKLVNLAEANRKALENVLSPAKIKELGQEKNEIAVLAQSFSAITNRLEENVKSLELAKRTLHTIMMRVGDGIAGMKNIQTFLDLIIETLAGALRAKVGMLLLYDRDRRELTAKSIYGVASPELEDLTISVPIASQMEAILKSREPCVISELSADFHELSKYQELLKPPVMLAPLIFREKPRGLILAGGREPALQFNEDELSLINNLASQTAVAIENARLNEDAEKTYFSTITALALAVDAKDRYSRGHLERVANHCQLIGKRLGLDENDLKTLRDAARLHDIGKIGIPDEVLQKDGPLNDQEWLLMRKHPEIGESIVKPIRSLQHLCDIIRHHHEKLDGTGYPDGLKDEEITPLVRIATIADIYDALTSVRPYRRRMTQKEAFQTLRDMKGKIDQEIVEIFIEALDDEH